MSDITKEQIEEAIHKADLLMRPYAIVCHKLIEEQLKSEFEKQYKILGRYDIEKDKIYVIDRKAFEDMIQIKPVLYDCEETLKGECK